MELSEIIPHIEALIFASDKPLTPVEVTELINNAFGFMEERISLDQIESAMAGIKEKYDAEFYPFEVKQIGGGWQFLTKPVFHNTIAQLNGEKFIKRLSGAALESLAIIAYKQPVTKGEIESIRGVNSDYSIQKLLEKELVLISGRNEDMPGKPLLYSTSKNFMDYFGINSAADLPKIKEVLADQIVTPTAIGDLVDGFSVDTEENELTDNVPALVLDAEGEIKEDVITDTQEATVTKENINEENIEAQNTEEDNEEEEDNTDDEKSEKE